MDILEVENQREVKLYAIFTRTITPVMCREAYAINVMLSSTWKRKIGKRAFETTEKFSDIIYEN